MRLNVGSGAFALPGWVNMDNEIGVAPWVQLLGDGRALPFRDESLDEIYAGHFVEHLDRPDALSFLAECRRCLKPGAILGVTVPDTRAVIEKYLEGKPVRMEHPVGVFHDASDLDTICKLFFYSTVQPSHHKWSYDANTLARLLVEGGFKIDSEINRWFDPRVAMGGWYQCGWQAVKES